MIPALDRVIYGYAQLIILGNYIVNNLIKNWINERIIIINPFTGLCLQSMHLWLDLYVRFSANILDHRLRHD
jgi:hypothetical protein